ncbi:MAG: BRO family protein [Dethiosulfovibrio sp.]|nr:BRO family protein [Dethiosulfovibrio sp.]
MSNITTFQFPLTLGYVRNVRVTDQNGEPWFIAKDVIDILGLSNITEAIRDLDEDEKNNIRNPEVKRGNPNLLIINESGLYSLILKSRKPEAKRFKKWVTSEVIPALRKDGAYIMGEEKVKTGEMSEDELILKAVTILTKKVERLTEERDSLQEQVTEHLEFMTVDE